MRRRPTPSSFATAAALGFAGSKPNFIQADFDPQTFGYELKVRPSNQPGDRIAAVLTNRRDDVLSVGTRPRFRSRMAEKEHFDSQPVIPKS